MQRQDKVTLEITSVIVSDGAEGCTECDETGISSRGCRQDCDPLREDRARRRWRKAKVFTTYDDPIEQPYLFPRIEFVVYFFRSPRNLFVPVSFDALDRRAADPSKNARLSIIPGYSPMTLS